jgi:4-hydroxybenzoate polyprenyltransferase
VLSAYTGTGVVAVLLLISFSAGYVLGTDFLTVSALYFLMNLAYSAFLKHVVLLDVFVIALGFVLRVTGGAVVINIFPSTWLLLCTLLISLFLAMCKRRHELVLLEDEALNHRKILGEYSPYFLDQLIAVVTASTLVTYALYTMSEEVHVEFGNNNLKYTIPFVLYGIFRYLYLVHQRSKGGSPTEIMMGDVPMLVNIGLWALVVVMVLYL